MSCVLRAKIKDDKEYGEPKGFPKPKFPSDRDSAELSSTTEDRTPDFLKPDFDCNFLSPEPPPPSGSAFQDLFRNNPDRRPSNAGFLRRPSTIHLRRPSTVVEHSLVPSQISSFDHDQQQKSYLQPSYEKQPSNYLQDQFTYQQNPQIQHQNPSVYLQDQSTYQQNPSTYQHQNQLRYPQNPSSYSHNQSPYQQNPSLYHQNQVDESWTCESLRGAILAPLLPANGSPPFNPEGAKC
ncbi:hypothetical protein JTE90_025900 [Oedothorax gibbosus]|uniref:Uncharacterized protein n=1 Tax=Oedothorax gibbosus TaxID=931172 RepID=A0AAV6TYK1_9ARAC|nr:hypothetical protein JTE90_025900 [Oedothorax gibbosus]